MASSSGNGILGMNGANTIGVSSGEATVPNAIAATTTLDDQAAPGPFQGDPVESGSPQFEEAVTKLTAMGFPESAVRSALTTYLEQNPTALDPEPVPVQTANSSTDSTGLATDGSTPAPRVAFTVVEQRLRAQYGWQNYNAAQLIVVRRQRGLPE